jgi:hypothetical protein
MLEKFRLVALMSGGSTSRKLKMKEATESMQRTPVMAKTQNTVLKAFHSIPPMVFTVAPADWVNSPSVWRLGAWKVVVLYLLISSFLTAVFLHW